MNGPVLDALLEFLFWWSLITVSYVASIFTLDWLLETWKQQRSRRRAEQLRMEQIDATMRSSIERLSTEFAAAQSEMHRAALRETDRR